MAITFTDANLRSASDTVLSGPTTISTLNQVGNQNAAGQATALANDNVNAVYYNNYKNIIAQYHIEVHNLNGTVSPDYDDSVLIAAAQGVQGNLHFPISPPWANFNPKLLDVNNGNPTTFDSNNELTTITQASSDISVLTSGFNDGGTSGLVAGAWSGGPLSVTTSGWSQGQRIVIGTDTLAVITAVAPGDPSGIPPSEAILTVTVLAGASSAADGTNVVASRGGFSNFERTGGGTTSPSILAYFEGVVASDVIAWNTQLSNQLTALNANDAVAPEAAQISQAITDVGTAQTSIAIWQAASQPYGDTAIDALQAEMTLRTGTQIPNRISEITTALGSVSQNSDGSFSGTGEYFQFFGWINQRISRSGGTLTQYYGYNLTISYVNNTTTNKSSQLDQFANNLVVNALASNASGTNVLQLVSTTGFSNGDTVYIMDDTSLPTVQTTISNISGNNITVAVPVSGFVANSNGRVVKVING